MEISVIIPTYKPSFYLRDCLDSLSCQTFDQTRYEVIIILNGEKQGYEDIILEYISNHTNINFVYFYSSIAGVSRARNIGLDIARGEYIAFVDDDDYVSKFYLEELYKHASQNVIPVCRPLSFKDGTSEYKEYGITKEYDRYCSSGRVPFYVAKRFFNGPVYKLIHRNIVGNRRFDERFKNGEDSLFMFLISDKIKYVEFAGESAIYYRRIRPNSATKIKKPYLYNFKNYTKLMAIHTSIFFKGFPRYNSVFYFNSMMGRFKSILLD